MKSCPFCSIVRGDDHSVREVARTKDVVVFFSYRTGCFRTLHGDSTTSR